MTGDRLSVDADGQVALQARHPWADGTTHLRFAPSAFLERLAVLVPRPRVNLVLGGGRGDDADPAALGAAHRRAARTARAGTALTNGDESW